MSQFPNDDAMSSEFNLPTSPPAWPKVIGIISIVLASMSAVCGGCGLVQNVINAARGSIEMQLPSGTAQLPAPSIAGVVLSGVGWLWAFLLLVAGIMTLKRKANGRMLHIVYSGVAIVLTVLSMIVAVGDMRAMTQAMEADPQIKQMAGMIQGIMYGAVCFGVALGLGYPVFCLVWFGMMGKRPEAGAAPEEPLV